ncbi:MAG TPA: EF-hand domain-containing protein [Bryobacteraceae bacterium]|nr:EF-hand domain-containing protein [Bryobacteraceae bacterium]
MLRRLYIQMLWAHPAQFRYRFCDEMLEIFDRADGRRESLRLLLDGLISLLRQWTIRPEFRQPWQPVVTSGNARDPLLFHLIEPYKPRPFALMQGGLMALLLILGVVTAISHGGKLRGFVIGVHHSRPSLLPIDRDSVGEAELNTTVKFGPERKDPWRPLALSYFRMVRMLSVIDTDGDLAISHWEMINAPAVLRKFDVDHDGTLSAQECGFFPGKLRPDVADRLQRSFMREHPVLAALDTNHDNEISAAEIANSSVALKKLDRNHDSSITAIELIPDQSETQAAMILSWFDTDDDGSISLEERSIGDAFPLRSLLDPSDRNHDGRITRAELTTELAFRAEIQRQLERARRSIQ